MALGRCKSDVGGEDIGLLFEGEDDGGESDGTYFRRCQVYAFKGGGEIVVGITAGFSEVEGNIEAGIGVGGTSNSLDRFSYR